MTLRLRVYSSFDPSTNKNSDMNSHLTKKENEVILHLSQGKSNIEIANSLFVSINTVRTHLSSCYKKMKVKNRTELVIKYLTTK